MARLYTKKRICLAAGKKLTPALRAAEFCDLKIVAKSAFVRFFPAAARVAWAVGDCAAILKRNGLPFRPARDLLCNAP
jgi:hypothetical protein